MNKHNIKWFENQRAIDMNAQQLNHKMDIKSTKINDSNNVNRIKITAATTISSTAPTVIPTTIPPIINKYDVIEYTPAWKSLINKIKSSNSNDLNGNDAIKTVHKQSTVVEANIHDTTHLIPPKITSTTERSFQRTSSKFCFRIHFYSVRRRNISIIMYSIFLPIDSPSHNADLHMARTDDQQASNVNEHPDNKTNVISTKNVKPYSWTYLDPSIMYRALTSPV